MIDHLLTFPNETAAHNTLSKLGFGSVDADSNLVWDRSRVDPGVKLITADAVWDTSDPPVLVTPEQVVPGFHVTIALPRASRRLHRIAGRALRVVENRRKARRRAKFHEYAERIEDMTEGVATDLDAAHITRVAGKIDKLKFRISPRFLGSDYPDPL